MRQYEPPPPPLRKDGSPRFEAQFKCECGILYPSTYRKSRCPWRGPYACKECVKQFARNDSLMRHQKLHEKNYGSGSNKIISTSSHSTSASEPNNGNNLDRSSHPAAPHVAANIPEEELELESLKGSAGSDVSSSSNSLSKKSSGAESSSTSRPVAYVKKPENEETPALSDNANSLKYGGANADLEEALANMAHIPPSKQPSLSVQSGAGLGGGSPSHYPLGVDSILLQQHKRTRSTSGFGGGGVGGLGLLSRAGVANGVNLEVDYTPQDIAEYIFWMGDERGVELALGDFVQDGLITAQDAVKFLEDVKTELSLLRNRYASNVALGRAGSGATGMDIANSHDDRGFWEAPARTLSKKNSYSDSYLGGGSNGGYYPPSSSAELMSSHPYYTSGQSSSSSSSSSSSPYRSSYGSLYKDSVGGQGAMMKSPSGTSANSIEDMLDYEEIVDKLRQADTKMREVALEGIIYQLARELFSMGLQQSADNSVPAFTKFIESLSVNGNISKDLERSVLETLVQALVDAANERGLLNAKSSSSTSSNASPTSAIERQLSALTGKSLGIGSGTPKPIIIKKKSV